MFGGNRVNCNVMLSLNGAEIETVNEIKLLGAVIDQNVCWKPHIKYS